MVHFPFLNMKIFANDLFILLFWPSTLQTEILYYTKNKISTIYILSISIMRIMWFPCISIKAVKSKGNVKAKLVVFPHLMIQIKLQCTTYIRYIYQHIIHIPLASGEIARIFLLSIMTTKCTPSNIHKSILHGILNHIIA